jgi:hypothetical protein
MHVWAQARPLLVAAGLAAALAASAFGVQVAALRHPAKGALVAAGAVKTLDEYRVTSAVEDIDGRRLSGSCFEGWFRDGRRANRRGAGAVLSDGDRIVAVGAHLVQFGRRRDPRPLARVELGLACPRVLGDVLAQRLAHREVAITRGFADGRRAYVLRFTTTRAHATFYVDARTFAPLAIVIRAQHTSARSDVEVARHDRARLVHVVKILRRGGERHGYAYPA